MTMTMTEIPSTDGRCKEHRVRIIKDIIFNVPKIDEKISEPDEFVYYYPEDMLIQKVFRKKIKFIYVVTELNVPMYVPLYTLEFSKKQIDELIYRYLVEKSDFDKIVAGF